MNSFNSVFLLRIITFIILLNVPKQVEGQTINIGLLINDESHINAKYAAELAIEQANLKPGLNGNKFNLVTQSMEGPWGTGAKKAVDLIFQDNVYAILGSHDGRNAHLVEQVTAKTRTIFLSAWATDPTLSKAFVPWYFNSVFNTEKQATSISNEIYQHRKLKKIISISDNSYDSNQFLNSFIQISEKKGLPKMVQLSYANASNNFSNLSEQLKKVEFDGIVIVGSSSDTNKIVNHIRKLKINKPIFSPSLYFGANKTISKDYENTISIDANLSSNSKWIKFKIAYFKRFKKEPGLIEAYAYDATNIIIEAITESGFNKEEILHSLAIINHNGVTGNIQFDQNGNRKGEVNLLEVKNAFITKVVR
ncbi:ABC transporter substrate-binding protein [Lutibacter citreus]|uniref:ABC transporter substrate-binding protein n=1 Tax=Lutibacter citreus TaxID=2138210 RepID=UPI000DBE9477|nr:ABC transporter substrate-binding protein [Lutibacter citreus]